MSKRDWGSNAPLGVGLAGAVLLLIAAGLIHHYKNTERAEHAASQQYEETKRIKPLGVAGSDRPYTDPKAYREEWRAERDLNAQREMAYWAFWTFIATCFGIVILCATFWETAKAAIAAGDAAQSSARSADIAKETLVATERAWLRRDDVRFTTGIIIDQGGARTTIEMGVTNVGKAPALDAIMYARMLVTFDGHIPVKQAKAMLECIRADPYKGHGEVVFPGDTLPRGGRQRLVGHPAVGKGDIDRALKESNGYINFFVVVCVDYTFPSDMNRRHQTGALLVFDRASDKPINVKDGNIPIEDLLLSDSFLLDHAD
jgi:hypothetical protein